MESVRYLNCSTMQKRGTIACTIRPHCVGNCVPYRCMRSINNTVFSGERFWSNRYKWTTFFNYKLQWRWNCITEISVENFVTFLLQTSLTNEFVSTKTIRIRSERNTISFSIFHIFCFHWTHPKTRSYCFRWAIASSPPDLQRKSIKNKDVVSSSTEFSTEISVLNFHCVCIDS